MNTSDTKTDDKQILGNVEPGWGFEDELPIASPVIPSVVIKPSRVEGTYYFYGDLQLLINEFS